MSPGPHCFSLFSRHQVMWHSYLICGLLFWWILNFHSSSFPSFLLSSLLPFPPSSLSPFLDFPCSSSDWAGLSVPSSESPRLGLFSALEQKWLDTEMYQKTQYTDQLTFSPDYTATFTANVWIIIIPESITWFYNSYFAIKLQTRIFSFSREDDNHVSTTSTLLTWFLMVSIKEPGWRKQDLR